MPIDEQNLIDKKPVASNVFACLYEGPGLLILRLLNSDGSVLNPAEAGFKLHNLTWNQSHEAGGAGNDLYFLVLKAEHYSLRLRSREVWTFGEPRTFGPEPSDAAEAERKRTFDEILAFMKNANVPEVSLPAPRRGKTKSTVTFLKHGDMGVPWDPKLFLPNNY